MHLIASNFYGGPEKQIIEHLKRLDKSQYHGALASFQEQGNPNETLEKAKIAALTHHGIPMSGPLDIRAQRNLTKLILREKVDLLCVHGYKSCVMGWWASAKAKIPILAFSRGYTAEDKKVAFYEWLERRVLRRVTGIISVSEGQRRRLVSFGIRDKPNWVVHNAVSVVAAPQYSPISLSRSVHDRLGIPENGKIVVSAGRLSPEKGHRFLVEAVSILTQKRNGAYFLFCGDGPCQKDLKRQAQQLGIAEQCRFMGFRRDLHEIFQAMDLMVLPSLTEGLPNVVLESFAFGKPVVATAVGGVPEVVEHGVNGFLIPSKRPHLMAEAIEKCLMSSDMAKQFGKAGRHKVESQFSFELQAHKLEAVYREVLQAF